MQTPPQADHDMSRMLMWVMDHLIGIKEDVSETRTDMKAVKARLIEGDHRMTRIEQSQVSKPAKLPLAISFAKEVATLKEWVIGAAFVVMAIRGIFQPAEMKALFLSVLEATLK